ncbi:mycofactocin biosynthesis peptidyl-dipeptidase MftE [Aquihabitans sp. G128]|uniref:mycofactocin biosynthesis peptidyl-dipeptidase MftE n=1 Tax=Aquihabitans sp. G128 TaxID=2849779 RepID=UPI001C21441A|nr:mycofactocin biosynthesis peptidyl-dipeptidase MftE [Aquihabitans sp. G128]QXC63339.1 mycofactocin biosynthesis peptidyl-dipeptidase MftE [Aquihabitans sp. G128]
MILGSATWTEVDLVADRLVLVVPLGATEQHGPHLPLATDTDVAEAVARRAAGRRSDVVVAPALPYGSSGEHVGFAGTLSIGQEALEQVVLELGRSADAFAGVVFASGHGGNAGPLARAIATLRSEGRQVAAWHPTGYVDAHAGRTETSLVLALDPGAVRAGAPSPATADPSPSSCPPSRPAASAPWPPTASSATPLVRRPPRARRCSRPSSTSCSRPSTRWPPRG